MKINKQLAEDCYQVHRVKDIQILLHKNALVPWFILVPLSDLVEYREIFELSQKQRTDLNSLSDALSQYLIENFSAEKINVAAIGNLVPQLHIHVVGRKLNDACWPEPIWGNLTELTKYSEQELEKIQTEITQLVSQ